MESRKMNGTSKTTTSGYKAVSGQMMEASGDDVHVVPRPHETDLADQPFLDKLHSLLEICVRSPLRTDLHDAIVVPRRLYHPLAFLNSTRSGSLDIDVLASLAGEQHLQSVPMIRRGDHHGIDVLAIKTFAKILVASCCAVSGFEPLVKVRPKNAAHRYNFRVGLLKNVCHDVEAFIPCADHTYTYLLLGTHHPRGADSRDRQADAGGREGSALHEITSTDFVTRMNLL